MKFRKLFTSMSCVAALSLGAAVLSGCHHNKVVNPIAQVDSKQPDKVLFDRAMVAMKGGKYEVARSLLQTMINTYPDSEFVARAKLSVADSWYAEGNTASYAQAEREYKDFQTFFPNMPEAAEAQMKIANIHYDEMGKPDRDYTQARRAEDEYRQMIQQYPDHKLVPQAKQRLREVQEVLGEGEYRIAHFYYGRESWPAAIARFKTLADTYPLYSQADESLYLLGQSYENEMRLMENSKIRLKAKARQQLVTDFRKNAVAAYSHLVERYPAGGYSDAAAKRLTALEAPVPHATQEAIAQNKQEIASRGEVAMRTRVMLNFSHRPDVAMASKVGEPTLEDPQQESAPAIAQRATKILSGQDVGAPAGKVNAEVVDGKSGSPSASSNTPANNTSATPTGTTPATPTPAVTTAAPSDQPAAAPSFETVPENPSATPSASSSTTVQGSAVSPAAPAPATDVPASTAPSSAETTGTTTTPQTQPQSAVPSDSTPHDQSAPAATGQSDAAAADTSQSSAQSTDKNQNDSSSTKTKKKKHRLF